MARTQYGTTWWGQRWLDALKGIDYANRIPRGKTYANTGKVKQFSIDTEHRIIQARVLGHFDPFYHVEIGLPAIEHKKLERLIESMARSPNILSQLASLELAPEVCTLAEQQGIQLFPRSWAELDMRCSCPDSAVPCKHIAAVIYRISTEIDANPFLIFSLHGVDLIDELKQRGIGIEEAVQTRLPTWCELLCETGPFVEREKIRFGKETGSWLEALKAETFFEIEDNQGSMLPLLPEQPAGYVYGNLREFTQKVLHRASRLAKSQMHDVREHSLPLFNEKRPFLCVNTWGQTTAEGNLHWTLGTKDEVLQQPSDVVSSDRHPGNAPLYMMFSGATPQSRFSESPEELEAFYHAWIIASKFVLTGNIMAQLYEPVPDYFATRWIPSTTNEEIASVVDAVGHAFEWIPEHFFKIAKAPEPMDPLRRGEIVLGLFIQSYVTQAYHELIGGASDGIIEHRSLFGAQALERQDKEIEAACLRLGAWLSPLTLSKRAVQAALIITDFRQAPENEMLDSEDDQREPSEEGFHLESQPDIGMELGFVPALAKAGEENIPVVDFQTVLTDPACQSMRFEALRLSGQLTHFCPELIEFLQAPEKTRILSRESLSTLMLKSIPKLRMLHVKLILPRALQYLLKPTVKMSLEVDEPVKGGAGFMTLASLLDFQWQVALGERTLSQAEFEQLCQAAGTVVRFHEQFVYIDPAQMALLEKRIHNSGKELNRGQLLAAAISGEYQGSKIELGPKLKKAIRELLSEKHVAIPKSIHATLRPYQERGYHWLMRNIRISLGAIIADDMGLGKTLQVITALEKLRLTKELTSKKALIVVPTSVLTNWTREIKKFAPKLRAIPYYGTARSLALEDTEVVLTTYGTLRTSIRELKKVEFRLLICDEAQAIKNHTTAIAKAMREIHADCRIAMSGTPVENRLLEYWSILDYTNRGMFGTAKSFSLDFANPIEQEHDKAVAERFKRLTAPFILRRLKTDKSIISDLPDKLSTNEFCELTKEQIALYEEVVQSAMRTLQRENDPMHRRALILKMMTNLKQVCNAPALYSKDDRLGEPQYSGKAERLFEILEAARESARKVLIFTQFSSMGLLLQRWIADRTGNKPQFLYGSTSIGVRQEMVDRFQTRRDTNVMILSLKAAGTGLNLTAASIVVHFDLWWNPAVEEQATDRAFRIGQTRDVQVYRFIMANTFEEKINAMIEAKKDLAQLTVAKGEKWIGELSNAELKDVFNISSPKPAR